jgi:hypothetical protein
MSLWQIAARIRYQACQRLSRIPSLSEKAIRNGLRKSQFNRGSDAAA